MTRSSLTFSERWQLAKDRRRGCLYHVLADLVYVLAGFHL